MIAKITPNCHETKSFVEIAFLILSTSPQSQKLPSRFFFHFILKWHHITKCIFEKGSEIFRRSVLGKSLIPYLNLAIPILQAWHALPLLLTAYFLWYQTGAKFSRCFPAKLKLNKVSWEGPYQIWDFQGEVLHLTISLNFIFEAHAMKGFFVLKIQSTLVFRDIGSLY